jgi:aminoglycoside phosphotransferase (APT) family kinase protein
MGADPWARGAIRLRDVPFSGPEIVDAVNRGSGARYQLLLQFPRGEFGAWLVRDPDRGIAVLKCRLLDDWREPLGSVTRIVDSLKERGYPAPRILASGFDEAIGTWYLHERLSGETPPELNADLIPSVVEVSALQRGHDLAATERRSAFDWTRHVRSMVESDEWTTIAIGHSDTAASLAREIARVVEDRVSAVARADDFVHGDFLVSQLLVDGRRITGVTDWEQAGYGDRAQDLALLFLNVHTQASRHHHQPDATILRDVCRAAIDASSAEAVSVFLAYEILSMLSFVIERNPRHVPWRLEVGRAVWNNFHTLV